MPSADFGAFRVIDNQDPRCVLLPYIYHYTPGRVKLVVGRNGERYKAWGTRSANWRSEMGGGGFEMIRWRLRVVAVIAACSAVPVALAAAPSPKPNASMPPTPVASASPKPSSAPSASPTSNLKPPSPSAPDSTVIGKIGSLERAGAGPLSSKRHAPRRTTAPSAFNAYLKDADPAVAARAAIAVGRLRNVAGVRELVDVLQSQTGADSVKAAG